MQVQPIEFGCGLVEHHVADFGFPGTILRTVGKQARDDEIAVEGVVVEALPNAMFRVKLETGHLVLGHISGRLRSNSIRILLGDRVQVVLSTYDLTKGRITYRM